MTDAIKQLTKEIEQAEKDLAEAYDKGYSARTYRKKLKALIELVNAKERFEYRARAK